MSVAIIGGGIAGLQCANILYKNGIEFSLFESSQLGGRILSSNLGNCRIDLGAQWIHGKKHNPLFSLAKVSNFSMNDDIEKLESGRYNNLNPVGRTTDGKEISSSLIKSLEKMFYSTVEEIDDISNPKKFSSSEDSAGLWLKTALLKQLRTKYSSDAEISAACDILNVFFTLEAVIDGVDSLNDLSIFATEQYEESSGQVRLKDGFHQFIEELTKNIPSSALHLKSTVSKIALLPNSVKLDIVHEDKTTTQEFDHVILTPSLGVLKSKTICFEPPLPSSIESSIENLGFGVVDKLFLVFDKPVIFHEHVWHVRENVSLGEKSDVWWKNIVSLTKVDEDGCVVIGWLSGKAAMEMEALSEEEVQDKFVQFVSNFLTLSVCNTNVVKFLRSRWASSSNICGSYTYFPSGADPTLIKKFSCPLVAENGKPLLMFAGEHTHCTHFSTAHGAYLSGEREAKRLIKYNQSVDDDEAKKCAAL